MKIYILAFLLLFQFSCHQVSEFSQASHLPESLQTQKTGTAETSIIVFRSADGGKTWQPIDAGLQSQIIIDSPWRPINTGNPAQGSVDSVWHPNGAARPAQRYITSIIQVGENFFCGHSDGIYRSSDKGNTWKLVLPSVEGKMFNVSVSGNVIYAIQREEHC